MTLRDVVNVLEAVALREPAVRTVVPNDVFALNTMQDARYGVFAWTQGQHRVDIRNGLQRFALTLFYVDRLTDDGANRLMIQSAGVQVLENILRAADASGVETDGEVAFTTFNQRFLDDCAGVYASVTLLVPADTTCEIDYL